MGRPNLTRHPKFLRLARMLGDDALARGSLELLWEVAYENGEPELGDAAGVEAAARWTGKPGKLTRALLDAGGHGRRGFIERVAGPSGRRAVYQIHDLEDHAPGYVTKRMQKEAERRKAGQAIRDLRADAGRKGAAARWQTDSKRPPLATEEDGKRMANVATPAPAPAPAPTPAPEQLAVDGTSTETSPSDAGAAPAAAPNGKAPALDAEAVAILRLLPAKGVDVAASLGLPRGAVDQALEELRGRGLVRLSSGMVPLWEVAP